MMKTHSAALLAPFALLMLAACSKENAPTGATAEKPAATAAATVTPEAREIFKTRCAACHGESGSGDGPGAAALTPKPRNYHDKEWQAKVSDEDVKKTILYGGAAVGKSPMMPSSPDLDSKPEVLAGLVAIVRSFGK